MLVLMRKPGERIRIRTPEGREVWLTIAAVQAKSNRMRIGFEADPDVEIDREEVVEKKERKQAPRDGGCVESRGPLAEGS